MRTWAALREMIAANPMGQGRFTTPEALANLTAAQEKHSRLQVRREDADAADDRCRQIGNMTMLTIERDAVEKGGRNSASWIDDGEKYAVIALAVKLDDPVPLQQMTPHHWVFADKRFDMPPHWREWLGTIRTGSRRQQSVPAQQDAVARARHPRWRECRAETAGQGTFTAGFCAPARLRLRTAR